MRGGNQLTRAILAGALLAQPAVAQQTSDGAHRAADRNGDGVVDRVEFQERMVDVFYLRDADKNGRLVRSELPKVKPEAFAGADVDGDGGLDLKEFLNARARDFTAADKDGDGGLSPAEAKAYE